MPNNRKSDPRMLGDITDVRLTQVLDGEMTPGTDAPDWLSFSLSGAAPVVITLNSETVGASTIMFLDPESGSNIDSAEGNYPQIISRSLAAGLYLIGLRLNSNAMMNYTLTILNKNAVEPEVPMTGDPDADITELEGLVAQLVLRIDTLEAEMSTRIIHTKQLQAVIKRNLEQGQLFWPMPITIPPPP